MAEFLLSHGPLLAYVGIAVFLMLTGAGLPVPEEVFIIAAGVASSHYEELNPWLAMSACLFGALAGDCIMYWIGYHFGRSVLREHAWWARFVKPEREAQVERMINKHGLKVFFLARFLVGLRSPVYLSAGILRVPFRRFVMIDLFCATVVIGLFFSLSYRYGTAITGWIRGAEVGLWVIVVLVLIAVGVYYYYWRRRGRKQAQLGPKPGESPSPEPEPAQPLPPVPAQLEEQVANVEEVV